MYMLIMGITGCSWKRNQNMAEHSESFFAMDTYMTFTAYGMDAEAAVLAAEDKIRELEALWSVTDENSDIYAVNHSAGQTVTIDQKTAELVSFALDMAEKTNGVLEPTIYPVLTAWGFTTGENRIPTEIELAGLDWTERHELQRQGIEVAKADGRHLGRPRVEYPENWEDCYGRWKSGVITAKEAMTLTGLKKDSFYRLAKKYESERCL